MRTIALLQHGSAAWLPPHPTSSSLELVLLNLLTAVQRCAVFQNTFIQRFRQQARQWDTMAQNKLIPSHAAPRAFDPSCEAKASGSL